MPTNPDVQSASPFWMTATASAADVTLLCILLCRPAAVYGQGLPAELCCCVGTQKHGEAAQLLWRYKFLRWLL